MPAAVDREIRRRGGAVRWRTVTLPNGQRAHVAVVRQRGPRGGRTVLVKPIR